MGGRLSNLWWFTGKLAGIRNNLKSSYNSYAPHLNDDLCHLNVQKSMLTFHQVIKNALKISILHLLRANNHHTYLTYKYKSIQ